MAWTATFAVLTLGGILVTAMQVARLSPVLFQASGGPSVVEPAPPAPGRTALKAEIDRRWPEVRTWGEALEREHDELQAEERSLDTLLYRIESRRRRYPGGFPPDAHADDQVDVANYTDRMTMLRTRIDSYNASLADYRRAAAEFDRLMQQYDDSTR